jgi:hypothetical protein
MRSWPDTHNANQVLLMVSNTISPTLKAAIMKSLICAVFAAAVFAAPTLSFAQATNTPVTRTEVNADLVRVEQAGYRPAGDDLNYPANIRAAEARIHTPSTADTSFGGVPNGIASGSKAPVAELQSQALYAHH